MYRRRELDDGEVGIASHAFADLSVHKWTRVDRTNGAERRWCAVARHIEITAPETHHLAPRDVQTAVFSTSPATLSSAATAFAGSAKPRGVVSGFPSSVGTAKPPMAPKSEWLRA